MAAKTQITNKGLELMASSSKATGQHWWIGWYALAFVPDELQENEDEQLRPGMTKLTKDGDIIYNIFQGDMNGDGYQTTKASNKFKSVNYDSNIKKNYRYVLDEDGRNNLVTWVDGKYGLKGAYIYQGVKVNASRDDDTIDYSKSLIPLPAPLLYTGVKAAGEGWSESGMDIFLGSGNDRIENFYPVDEVGEGVVPRVSTDFRNYEGYKNGLPTIEGGDAEDYAHALGETFNDVDIDGWLPSVSTYTQNDETDMGEDYNQYCYQYWKVLSISNFNKYCAPVNASGLLYDENTGCRNMAKATKYFPISDYSVTSTAKTADNEYATGIKLKVQLKLNGNAEDGAYFKEVETGDDDNVATLNPSPTDEQHALFNSQKVSFKFNRIGIYAVPMRQYGCSGDSGEMKAQYQIDTEAEPVLFAVCEWDSPVTLSDSGEGLSEFQSDIFIDLSGAVDDSSVIRESAVFYNLYEDDAIDWYKNQLLANASMAEALVNMQIEMGYLRDQKNAKAGCCPKQEAIQQKEKSATGLRNLVDARDYNSNSVRNRLAQIEGVNLKPEWSDIMPKLGLIGYPGVGATPTGIHARKANVTTQVEGTEQTNSSVVYSALYGFDRWSNSGFSYEDAVIDGNTYINMVPNKMPDDSVNATRIGGLWVRRKLFFEMFSFDIPNSVGSPMAYDYDDNLATNNYTRVTGDVTDFIGTGTDSRYIESGTPYITVTMTPGENSTIKIETKDGNTTTQGYPSELDGIPAFASETNRSLNPYRETKRVYTIYYIQNTYDRNYGAYKIKRTTSLTLPKTQMYRMDEDVYDEINQQIASTGWRIPTTADWQKIIQYSTPEKIKSIRGGNQWGLDGGSGEVYPLGGGKQARTSIDEFIPETPAIYLAIADDDDHVVTFDGSKFEITAPPSVPGEAGFKYLHILCVADAEKISDGTSNYKLGYDSYSLMEGSITEGTHNFNAGENSIMCESANYNSIFGGKNIKVNNSAHNAVLHGYGIELLGAVHSTVFGSGVLVNSSDGTQTCRALVSATNSVVSGCLTSAIFAEDSTIEAAYQSSIIGDENDIRKAYCSRFLGQYIEKPNNINNYFSDLIAYDAHHLPALYMCRATLTYDHSTNVPTSLAYAGGNAYYSELYTQQVLFLKKNDDASSDNSLYYSRLAAYYHLGIINTMAVSSDIFAYGHVYSQSGSGINNSWLNYKTLESVAITYSSLKLSYSSITSNYIDGHVPRSYLNFCDFALAYTAIQMSGASETTHTFNFGVMRLSHSTLCQCDCSYVFEMGTRHHLYSAQIHYATLFGNQISMSSNYIRNTHIYGSLHLSGSLDNHIILCGLDGTNVGNTPASNYISEFGSYIQTNYHNYPMIWSMGGLGLFMNKMVLGDNGVASADKKAPSIGDVLSVVGVEGNLATVAWKSGGAAGGGGGSHLVVVDTDFTGHYYKNGTEDGSHSSTSFTGGAASIPFKGVGVLRGNGLESIDSLFTFSSGEDKWFDGSTANGQFRALSAGDADTIDIYTWDIIDEAGDTSAARPSKRYKNLHGHTVSWGYGSGNPRPSNSAGSQLTIDADSLVEDKVYEIKVHYMCGGSSGWETPAPTLNQNITSLPSPVSSTSPLKISMSQYTFENTSLEADNSNVCVPGNYEVRFLNSSGATFYIARWQVQSDSPQSTGNSSFSVIMNYNLKNTSGSNGLILPEIGFGSTIFFKHGQYIYVMTY